MNVFLEWSKCKAGTWCTLSELDLDHGHFDDMEGVYVIWYGKESPVALRVGYGYIIRNCLANERNDKDVLAYKQDEIYVTWGKVGLKFRDGVIKYVADALQPELESSSPDVQPIEVSDILTSKGSLILLHVSLLQSVFAKLHSTLYNMRLLKEPFIVSIYVESRLIKKYFDLLFISLSESQRSI